MVNSNPVGIYISVSEVFPDLNNDLHTFKKLLQSLSRTDTLFWCARLNNVISHSSNIDHISRQQFGLSQFFTAKEIRIVDDFVQKRENPSDVTIFFRGQLLELMRWVVLYCNDHPGDGTTFEDPEIRRTFAKVALMAGDIWAKRVFGNRFSLEGGIPNARRRALGAIRKGIEDNSKAPDLARALGRGWALFSDYFPDCYSSFEDDFKFSFGLSLEEYYMCLSAIIINFTTEHALRNGSGIIDINSLGRSIGHDKMFQKYFVNESQSPDEMRDALWAKCRIDYTDFDDIPDYSYRALRERPILRSNDGRGIILDLLFCNEKATVGPLFYLLKRKVDSNRIFGAFGTAFEKYSCDILRRILPDYSSQIAKRLHCNMEITVPNQKNSTAEIDAFVDDVTEIVLFEIKAVWLQEDNILTDDAETYLAHLREKYGISTDNSAKTRIKGIGQLARIIDIISKDEFLLRNEKLGRAEVIYPILLVHDPLLAAPVHGDFLASECKNYLRPDVELKSGLFKKGRFSIHSLIIMTVEDLENLETSLEHFGLRDLLAAYSRDCADRSVSLHNYIATSSYSKKMFYNRSLPAKALELIDKTRILFAEREDE